MVGFELAGTAFLGGALLQSPDRPLAALAALVLGPAVGAAVGLGLSPTTHFTCVQAEDITSLLTAQAGCKTEVRKHLARSDGLKVHPMAQTVHVRSFGLA